MREAMEEAKERREGRRAGRRREVEATAERVQLQARRENDMAGEVWEEEKRLRTSDFACSRLLASEES